MLDSITDQLGGGGGQERRNGAPFVATEPSHILVDLEICDSAHFISDEKKRL